MNDLEAQLRDLLGLDEEATTDEIIAEVRSLLIQEQRRGGGGTCGSRRRRRSVRRRAWSDRGSGSLRTDRAIRERFDRIEANARSESARTRGFSGRCGDESRLDRPGAARVGDRILPGEYAWVRGIRGASAGGNRGNRNKL